MSVNVTSWFPHVCERMAYEGMPSSKGFSVRRISPFERNFKRRIVRHRGFGDQSVGSDSNSTATATAAAEPRYNESIVLQLNRDQPFYRSCFTGLMQEANACAHVCTVHWVSTPLTRSPTTVIKFLKLVFEWPRILKETNLQF